jgi:Fur family ferric uptake transcriptional regulator
LTEPGQGDDLLHAKRAAVLADNWLATPAVAGFFMERSTRQRTAIHAAIVAAKRPLLPQEILALAQEAVKGLGIATVYRNIKALVDGGEIQTVNLPGDSPRYESSAQSHHHHFQCRQCSQVFDVHDCPGDLRSLAPQGFIVDGHELTLYGRCADCAPQSQPARGARQAR